jgi:hypothetical protein
LFLLKDYSNNIDERVLSFEQIKKNLELDSIKLADGGKSYTHVNAKCDSSPFEYRRVAVITPYRNRLDNLKVFLNNMHRYWTRQKINYALYLIEPSANLTFNRGLLMNIGFREALNDSNEYNCFIFHDCDMIPEDLRVEYTCNKNYPVHLAVAVKKLNYV